MKHHLKDMEKLRLEKFINTEQARLGSIESHASDVIHHMLETELARMHVATCEGAVMHEGWNGETDNSAALSVLAEARDRMTQHRIKAAAHHAAFNPAEVITQLMLEIETGRFEVAK